MVTQAQGGSMTRFALYLFRWQLSTPILAVVLYLVGAGFWGVVVANLVGGSIFYGVDKHIFKPGGFS